MKLMVQRHPQTERGSSASPELLAAQSLVLETIASRAPLDDSLRALAAYIDLQHPRGMCSILLLDTKGGAPRLAAAPKLPQSFAHALASLRVDSPCEQIQDLALEHGFDSCRSTPIYSSAGPPLAIITLYRAKEEINAESAHLARIAIEHTTDEQLRASRDRFQSLLEN